jgi:hypothetical protein
MRGTLEIIQEREEAIGRDLALSWIASVLALLLLAGWGL